MKPIDADGFEQKFRADPDPWNYDTSPFERFKRRILTHSCGNRTYGRGLELGCANGVVTQSLSRRCLQLDAVDASPTALRLAARRDYGHRRPRFIVLEVPARLPGQLYDLIVVSEVAYYLAERDLNRLNKLLDAALARGGRIVILHHVVPFHDVAQHPAIAHRLMKRFFGNGHDQVIDARYGRFAVAAFGK